MAVKFNPLSGKFDLVSKASIANGITAGQMAFWNGSTWTYTETSEMFWDDTNKRLGVGTATPDYKLDVRGVAITDAVRSGMGFDIYPVPNPTSLSATLEASATGVNVGAHIYFVTFTTAFGETSQYPVTGLAVTVTTGNMHVRLAIPVSTDPRVTGRKLYRTRLAYGYWSSNFLASIPNNTDTEYLDTITDAVLATQGNGVSSGRPNTTSKQITVNGVSAMLLDPYSTTFGIGASTGTGGQSTAIGYQAGYNSNGTGTTSIGFQAGYRLGNSGVAIGAYAAQYATGQNNIAIGYNNFNNATASNDIAMGTNTLRLDTGGSNIGIGINSLYSNTTGTRNVSLGEDSLRYKVTGNDNVALGYYAGRFQADGVTTLGTAIQSVYIGSYAKGYNDSDVNSIVIGYSAIGVGANSVVLGNDSITKTILKGNVGIGTDTPSEKLHIKNNVNDATRFIVENSDLGTGANASFSLANGTSFGSNVVRLIALGKNYSTSGAFVQNGGVISAETTMSGGLSVMARHVDGEIRFYAGGYTDAYKRMTINSVGNVGIGTATPDSAFRMHIVGPSGGSDFPLKIQAGNATDGYVGYLLYSSANVNLGGLYSRQASDLNNLKSKGLSYVAQQNDLTFAAYNNNEISFWTNTGASSSNSVQRMTINKDGNVGIGTTTPTAVLHLKAGTATANTSPLKFTAGTNLGTPEAGALEFDGTNLYITQSDGTRKTLAFV